MTVRAFVDTNVLVYLHDGRDKRKQERARGLLEELATDAYAPVVSTQVLQEAYVALTRKLLVPASAAAASLKGVERAGFAIQPVGADLVWAAAARSETGRLSFWDALIIEAALAADCSVLYSEDLNAGQRYGTLAVVNPFQGDPQKPTPTRAVNDRRRSRDR